MHLAHQECINTFVVGALLDLQADVVAVCWVRLTSLSPWPSVGAIRANCLSSTPFAVLVMLGTFRKAGSPHGHPLRLMKNVERPCFRIWC